MRRIVQRWRSSLPPAVGQRWLERSRHWVLYDPRLKQPVCVYERLTAERLKGDQKQPRGILPDGEIPSHLQATRGDYRRSGFDRGHHATWANHRTCALASLQVNQYTNISPQLHEGFNRGAWYRLEKAIRLRIKKVGEGHLYSGPLFLARNGEVRVRVIGPGEVPVPNAFFKILFTEQKREAWMLPHEPIPDEIALENFLVDVREVEEKSGLLFHPPVD